jgi:hypothetical protein
MTSTSPKETILQEAQRIIHGERNEAYGRPIDDFTCSAGMISAYLSRKLGVKVELGPEDIPILMILVKVSREAHSPKRDNLVDICGYAACLDWVKTDQQIKEVAK